jgi:PAS domain S-box-containing protein
MVNNLSHAVKLRTLAVEEYISRAGDITLQVTSRTQIRKKLEAYNNGKVTLDEVVNFTSGKLADAMKLSEEAAGISRLGPDDELLVSVGLRLPGPEHWPVPPLNSREVMIHGPMKLGEEFYLLLGAHIFGEEPDQVGTDIVLFKIDRLQRLLRDYSGLGETGETILGAIHFDRIQLFSPLRKDRDLLLNTIASDSYIGSVLTKSIEKESGITSSKAPSGNTVTMAYGPIKNLPWGIAVKMDSRELFLPLNKQVLLIFGVIIVFILIGTFGMVLLLRPLTEALQRESSERRRSEEALRNSEKRFHTLVHQAADAMFLHDMQGRLINVNQQACESLGYSSDELLNMKVSDVDAKFSNHDDARKIWSKLSPGRPVTVEGIHKRKDGTTFPVEVRLGLLMLEGSPSILAFARDITERKVAEVALKESEKKYRTLVDNALVGIYKTNRRGEILFVNEALSRMMGFDSPEEMKRESVLARYKDPRDREILMEKLNETGSIDSFETVILTKDGKTLNMLLSATLDGDDLSGMIVDITDLKNLERQLLHAQKMEAVGQLAGGVAHDFNNILQAMIGYGEFLQNKLGADNPLRQSVDIILSSAMKASSLTQSLLAFSRKQVISPARININNCILMVEKLLSRIIGENIELKTVVSDEKLIVLADSGQIDQVLINLATNARDAMPDGGTLTIETERERFDEEYRKVHGYGDPGNYARISFTDTGHGMDEKTMKNIFEPFFTTKEVGRGTGLGLAMVYGIVKQHNGYINVYSEVGIGTTFNIYLPLADTPGKESIVPAETLMSQGGTEIILLAEDDEMVRSLIKTSMEMVGYRVIEAEDGLDALQKFRENVDSIDLLLLDVVMPRKNGKDVYNEIRKTHQEMKVLFISGYASDIIQEKGALEEGLNFVSKPISPNHLLKIVREILDS